MQWGYYYTEHKRGFGAVEIFTGGGLSEEECEGMGIPPTFNRLIKELRAMTFNVGDFESANRLNSGRIGEFFGAVDKFFSQRSGKDIDIVYEMKIYVSVARKILGIRHWNIACGLTEEELRQVRDVLLEKEREVQQAKEEARMKLEQVLQPPKRDSLEDRIDQ